MTEAFALTHPVIVDKLPDLGTTVKIAPDEGVREALAKQLKLVAIPALKATVTVVRQGSGVRVGGHVSAVVRQACVATLEDFDAPIEEDIDLGFAPPHKLAEVKPGGAEIDVGELDEPDPLIDGVIDVGAVVVEFLALGIDPYPRKPGAVFKVPKEAAVEEKSPFAALAKLRDPESD
ncbi:MAG TPA: DUF177 domain-containing protein [Ancylobacter sp.]